MEPFAEWLYEILVTYEPLPEEYLSSWTVRGMEFDNLEQLVQMMARCYLRRDFQYFEKLSFLLSEDAIEFDYLELIKKFSPELLI